MSLRLQHIVAMFVLLCILAVAPTPARALTCVDGRLIDDSGNDTGETCTPGSLDQAVQNIQSSAAAAYDFKNEGIFGCNQVAGANASAGTMAAIGGVYVPVNDAAVTLNTGILVYKECVLRPLQDRLRESAMSALLKKANVAIETGREGNKLYVVNWDGERKAVADRALLATLTDEKLLEKLHPAFKDTVRSSIARTYRTGRSPESQLECSYKGNVNDVLKGRIPSEQGAIPDVLGALDVLKDPACNPMGAYAMLARISNDRINQAAKDWETNIVIGRGYYPKTDGAADPLAENILSPAATVQESFQQIIGSPVRQLESANDIGQMIGALYAGVTTQIISDSRGLAGLTQSMGGRPSYLDQVAKESSQGVIGAAVNAALTILNSARQIEGSYLASMNAVASNLTQSINQIRSLERQCWNLVVPKARASAAQQQCTTDPGTGEETCTGGFALDEAKISAATSSLAFSQRVVDAQVTPLAQAALTNIRASERALGLIDQLIAGVTNTASLTAQRLALQQLDSLVAQKALHTQYDAQNAAQQRDDVASAMASLVDDTRIAWADSTDPSVGWCNINNPDIPRLWAGRWKK